MEKFKNPGKMHVGAQGLFGNFEKLRLLEENCYRKKTKTQKAKREIT